jgi:fructose-1-phosphate kinase PfkB-like protein
MIHGAGPEKSRPLLNPLGAGDTCSGVFFLEFLDTQDAVTSFRYGLAAASASCILIDCTSHFSKFTMKIVFDKIQVKTLSL